jgi:hypothetical protein
MNKEGPTIQAIAEGSTVTAAQEGVRMSARQCVLPTFQVDRRPAPTLASAGVRPQSAARLEPVVSDTSTVSRQVLECVQPVEVVDRYLCHGLRFSET